MTDRYVQLIKQVGKYPVNTVAIVVGEITTTIQLLMPDNALVTTKTTNVRLNPQDVHGYAIN